VKAVADRRLKDAERSRGSASVNHLRQWQMAERDDLRELCHKHGVLFVELTLETTLRAQVSLLLAHVWQHDAQFNLSAAERILDQIVSKGDGQLNKMLVLDADRTLAPVDTGTLYWQMSNTLKGNITVKERIHSRTCSAVLWAIRTRRFAKWHGSTRAVAISNIFVIR
jgi:hypothetical protein